ncbi:uncharacterized protein ATNIH1004_006481 [Aspergillus tanneri]|uniref:Uncharacterized protein n=1 Tax=Aspergillus tanneri TaxID=1220188 RepID=A0A5M9MR53_9EURO|nr:uncharacterized protein ATNIH1004_006481 [Aspergillus tanneri]KAA8647780.1 hypothetical protein ATNIH1004_006481 [Aspergillus tanneri]
MIGYFEVFGGHKDSRQRQGTIDICCDLLNSGGFMTVMALDSRHIPNFFDLSYHLCRGDGRMNDHIYEDYSIQLIWQLADEKEVQDIDLPEELLPLVYRSKSHLISLLRKGVDLQNWVASYTQWPTGLALLFESGYTPTYSCIREACEVNCEESIKLLINTQRCYIGPIELQIACSHHNGTIMELIVNALVGRRKRLQTLAETHLPDEVNSELGSSPSTLMSLQAYRAYQLLKASSVHVDNVEETTRWSVYDYIGVNLKSADLLWNSGFQDVDELYGNEKTCLMGLWWNSPPCSLNAFLEKANWLINKGANINRKSRDLTAVHFLGHDVGKLLHSINDSEDVSLQVRDLSQDSIGLMLRIFSDDTRDDCCCPCSSAGCIGLTAFLRGLFPTRSGRDLEELVHRLAMVIECLAVSLEPENQERLIKLIAPCVLRFITYQSLNISHTCTHEYYRGIDAEEIEEIHDEERFLILELDDLLAEFLAKFKSPGLSFPDYLIRSWWVRMNKIRLSCGPPSEKEINQVLETGVVLHG